MEKYYNSFDRFFVADEFEAEFTDITGKKCSGIVGGASIFIATIGVKQDTREPVYSINKSDKSFIEDTKYANMFYATVNADTGILLIPNVDAIMNFKSKTGLDIAGKIVDYTIDIRQVTNKHNADAQCLCLAENSVSESCFIQFIKEHFDRFNNSNNFPAQSIAYNYHQVISSGNLC